MAPDLTACRAGIVGRTSLRSAVTGIVAAFAVSACGGAGQSASLTAGTDPSTIAPATTTITTNGTSTTMPRLTTTTPPLTTITSRAAPTSQATAPGTTSTVPPVCTVSRGTTFLLSVGETVSVLGEGLSVTSVAVVADSRCRPGQQCIVAGNATLSVTVRKEGMPAAMLALNTDDPPTSARYGMYDVELVQLGFGSPPVARLRVV